MTNSKQANDMLELLRMSRDEFITINKEYLASMDQIYYKTPKKDIIEYSKCPLHLWVVYNHMKCKNEMVSNTTTCPLCNNPVCPDCMNHNVEQLSRVTGYLGGVSGWNAAKKQEFLDRSRYNL